MLEMGARFANDLYVHTAFDPDNGDCVVTVEAVIEDEKRIITGEVVWDDGE